MAGSVKNKIRLGTLFLFLLLMLSGGVGIFYLVKFKNDAREILKDNYESLDYCHTMQKAIDSFSLHPPGYFAIFDQVLKLQEDNITEPGESEVTYVLRLQFNKLKSGDTSGAVQKIIHHQIQKIISLNMAAIQKKNQQAADTAAQALTYITLIGAFIFFSGAHICF